jgi:putative transposase
MDEITHEVRLENWKKIAIECGKRPEGMSARRWLSENNIPEKKYYYWLRQIRRAAYNEANLPTQTQGGALPAVRFADVTPSPAAADDCTAHDSAVMRIGCASIEITPQISDTMLIRIMKAARHAC